MMEENDDDGAMFTKLRSRMHQDCKFFPPTYYNHWEGGDETMVLLKCVSEVFGRSFQYNRQFLSDNGRDWCLEFEADIDQDPKARLQGVDLVKLDEEGMIIEFRVLARPPNAVAALKKVMVPKVVAPMAAMKAKKALGLLL
ncbi:hypothetical protein ScalyP_jg1911 [Parmales sp. scaly parma]|nr:hypothetical protein ScalyP_jg1911 [Parmales sp. scaly parma]